MNALSDIKNLLNKYNELSKRLNALGFKSEEIDGRYNDPSFYYLVIMPIGNEYNHNSNKEMVLAHDLNDLFLKAEIFIKAYDAGIGNRKN